MIDSAQIAICDRDQAEAAFVEIGNDGMPIYYDALQSTELAYQIRLPQGNLISIVRTGEGDGEYPVYLLASHDSLAAGVEVDFFN